MLLRKDNLDLINEFIQNENSFNQGRVNQRDDSLKIILFRRSGLFHANYYFRHVIKGFNLNLNWSDRNPLWSRA